LTIPGTGDEIAATDRVVLPVAHISSQRLEPYFAHAFGDESKSLELYTWGRELSAALFRDISILEVALRDSIDRTLVERFGGDWHLLAAALFDERTYRQLAEAWERLPSKFRNSTGERIRGRLIAGCMFGVWVSALDAGGKTGLAGPCSVADHDRIWTRDALLSAFPGAGRVAGMERRQLDRAWAHSRVREVHILRNRIAHHESLINGYPIPGSGSPDAGPERRSVRDGIAACGLLAAMLDRDLQRFLAATSRVEQVLAADPRIGWG